MVVVFSVFAAIVFGVVVSGVVVVAAVVVISGVSADSRPQQTKLLQCRLNRCYFSLYLLLRMGECIAFNSRVKIYLDLKNHTSQLSLGVSSWGGVGA